VTVFCDLYMLWGNITHCVELSGEDLSRYSNKIEFSWFKEMSVPYYRYLT